MSNELRMVWLGKQSEALLDTTKELDIEGAVRASKTTICIYKMLASCMQNPGIHWLLSRWTDDATDALLRPVWRAACTNARIPLDWNGTEKYDELPNGSRVYIRGLKSQDQTNRYGKFRGLTLASIYVDQAEELPEDIYRELALRLSQKGYPQQIIISPQSVEEDHWIAKHFPADNSLDGRKYIPLSIYDNEHNLPPGYIDHAISMYPLDHPKHKTMVLGQRGMNVVGEAVYKGAFIRPVHERKIAFDPTLPLEEAIDFGKHHPCVVWRQQSPLGQVNLLGGILGQDFFLDEFVPILLRYRQEWFPDAIEVKTCCDPAGATDNSQGTRKNGVQTLKDFGLSPRWHKNSNAPDVRLSMVERYVGHMRRRTPMGEGLGVDSERWLRIGSGRGSLGSGNSTVVNDPFVAAAFEAGYVWDEHFVSVGSKQVRKPKKDGWYEHGMNCCEYLELNFGAMARKKPRSQKPPTAPPLSGENAWLA